MVDLGEFRTFVAADIPADRGSAPRSGAGGQIPEAHRAHARPHPPGGRVRDVGPGSRERLGDRERRVARLQRGPGRQAPDRRGQQGRRARRPEPLESSEGALRRVGIPFHAVSVVSGEGIRDLLEESGLCSWPTGRRGGADPRPILRGGAHPAEDKGHARARGRRRQEGGGSGRLT